MCRDGVRGRPAVPGGLSPVGAAGWELPLPGAQGWDRQRETSRGSCIRREEAGTGPAWRGGPRPPTAPRRPHDVPVMSRWGTGPRGLRGARLAPCCQPPCPANPGVTAGALSPTPCPDPHPLTAISTSSSSLLRPGFSSTWMPPACRMSLQQGSRLSLISTFCSLAKAIAVPRGRRDAGLWGCGAAGGPCPLSVRTAPDEEAAAGCPPR